MPETSSLQRFAGFEPVHRVGASPIAPYSDHLSELWFKLSEHDWTSLALVPAERGSSAVSLACALAEFGRPYQSGPLHVLNMERMNPSQVPDMLQALRDAAMSGARVLIAVGSPLAHHIAVPVTRAADAAILVVKLGRTETRQARRTIACIGPSYFVGTVIT
jgi:hypothetical protein